MYSHKELEAEGLLDFRVFLCHVWDYLGLPAPTRVQLDIAYWLQHGPQRGILQAFRGVGKSWITVAFVLWNLLLDPQKNIMVVSASEGLASDFTTFCKQLIMGMPLLQHLQARPGQRDKMDAFDVGPAHASKDPSVKSVGITGQITGSRADIIVGDDIEVPKNSYSHVQRERLADLVKEFDAVLKPNAAARVIYLGTPQVEQTLYRRLEGRGYVAGVWPVRIPDKMQAYRGRLGPLIQRMIDAGAKAGALVDPTRFTEDVLAGKRASYGAAGFNLQFMLDTTESDAEKHPLKLNDLIVHDCDSEMAHVSLVWGGAPALVLNDLEAGGMDGDAYHRPAWASPELTKYTSTVLAIDPSGTGTDETAFAVVKYLNGFLYLMDIGGFIDGYGEATLAALAGKALRWGVNNVIIEKTFGGGMFDQLLKPHLIRAFGAAHDGKTGSAGRIDDEWTGRGNAQKESRICDVLEPVVKNHRLVVHRAVIEADIRQQQEQERYSFVQQYTRMARVKGCLPNEDRLDALAMGCGYFVERMNRDASRALEQHKAALLDKELREFKKHVFGVGPRHGGYLVRE